jgi:hypothetical protein
MNARTDGRESPNTVHTTRDAGGGIAVLNPAHAPSTQEPGRSVVCRAPSGGVPSTPSVPSVPSGPGVPPPTGDVIESRIDGEFAGWTGETLFPLLNGQVWQQASYAYHYDYAYSPSVLIERSGAQFEMHVDGVDPSVTVRLVELLVDSAIVNDFNGWDGDTLFELQNGQIWQQVGPGIETRVAVRPRALIFRGAGGVEMHVGGVDSNVRVEQLR